VETSQSLHTIRADILSIKWIVRFYMCVHHNAVRAHQMITRNAQDVKVIPFTSYCTWVNVCNSAQLGLQKLAGLA
jgi:hypothetical protein